VVILIILFFLFKCEVLSNIYQYLFIFFCLQPDRGLPHQDDGGQEHHLNERGGQDQGVGEVGDLPPETGLLH